MKTFLSVFLCLAALICRAEDPAYSDIDAENYVVSRNITDRAEITRVHAWYTGLKQLGLYSNIVHSVSYRSAHNAVNGATVVAMNGGNGTITGGIGFSDRGATYDGSSGNYIAYSNPLSHPITNYTIVCAFDAPRASGNYYHIFGSFNTVTTRGPALWAGGTPNAGAQDGFYYQTYSEDGTVSNGGDSSSLDGLAAGPTWGTPNFVSAALSDQDYRIVSGLDLVSESLGEGSLATTWNNNATWRVGQNLAGANRLVGNVAYTGVWNELLTLNKVRALRRLYAKTLGYGYMQRVQFILDGDSLTKGTGAGELQWPLQIQTNLTYGALIAHQNQAVSGDVSATVLANIPSQLYPYNVNFDYCDRQYYFTYTGANDFSASVGLIMANLKAIWTQGRAAGYRVVAFTFPKIDLLADGTISAATRRSVRDAANAQIRQSSSLYDILIELDKIPLLQDQSNATYYLGDFIHYTTAGHALIAAEVMRKIPIP